MTAKEQRQLYRLLQLYMAELIREDTFNREVRAPHKYLGRTGIKAQFNHARCIARRLGVKIEKEIL